MQIPPLPIFFSPRPWLCQTQQHQQQQQQQQQQLGGAESDSEMTAAMDRWRAAKRQVRRVKDAIEKEADPAEKMDLQELLDKDELAVVAANRFAICECKAENSYHD